MQKPSQSEWIATHQPCPCGKSSDAFSINDKGWGKCFSCGKDHKITEGEPTETRQAPKASPDLVRDLTFSAIPSRGLTEETCRKWSYGTGTDRSGQPVQVAQYFRDGRVIAQKLRGRDKKFSVVGIGKDLPLFGQHLWGSGGKMLVVTEGEIDALTVSQLQEHRWPVVSLPNGAQSAVKALAANLEWLETFEKVILMFDMDEPGRQAAAEASEVLSPGKAFIAQLPMKDPNECVLAGKAEDVRRAIWNASPYRPDAILAGADLWERVAAYKEPDGLPWPWEGLNAVALKMVTPGVHTVVAGTGSGKSTLMRALEHHIITQGANVGALHLEESPERTAMGIVGYHMGRRLDLGTGNVGRAELETAFRQTAGREGVFFYDAFGSTAVDNILSRIRFLAKAGKCRYVILDHLSILVSGLEVTDERKAIDVAMTRLRTLAEACRIGIVVVVHLSRSTNFDPERGDEISLRNIRGSNAVAQLSDTVIALERDQQGDGEAKNLTTVRVLKNRTTGETGPACKLLYDKSTGRLVEVPLSFGEEQVKGDEFDADTTAEDPCNADAVPF